jgi:N-acetylglucosamine kinase-like BadF-type ATPase
MILLADSGSTKTDWGLVEGGQLIRQISTKGTNPFFQQEEEISNEIGMVLVPQLPTEDIDDVFFYGAGCAFPDKIAIVRKALLKYLKIKGKLEVSSDMLAAARSLCGHKPGIACILGTGSNSCSFDGTNIVSNVSPLGFILGDEGSGAVLGKKLIGDVLKNQLPKEVCEKFFDKYQLTRGEIIDRVYCKSFPNRFLASLVPFLEENITVPEVHQLLEKSFEEFLQRNVTQYEDYDKLPIHFIGSVAFFFRDALAEAVKAKGMNLGKVVKSPMKGLVEYHKN